MAKIHFRSIEASHNKSDVTNRFGDRDFIFAVCSRFLCYSNRFEVIRDFHSLKNGGLSFAVDGGVERRK
jgi:hypothetical protein